MAGTQRWLTRSWAWEVSQVPDTIRLANERDLPAILRLIAADSLTGVDALDAGEPARHYVEALETIQADPNNEFWVLEDNSGAVAGCFQMTYTPGMAYLGGWRATVETVRVAPHLRGKGLGRTMMEWAIDRARNRGCALFQLATNKQRDAAHRFYKSLGFVASHEGMKLRL